MGVHLESCVFLCVAKFLVGTGGVDFGPATAVGTMFNDESKL